MQQDEEDLHDGVHRQQQAPMNIVKSEGSDTATATGLCCMRPDCATYITTANHHTTNKCTNCMSFILNHFFKTLSLLLHVSIAYHLSSSRSTYSS